MGLWIRETEGATEWLNIFEELKSHGAKKVTYLSADGLTGLEEAARAAFGDDLVYHSTFAVVFFVAKQVKISI